MRRRLWARSLRRPAALLTFALAVVAAAAGRARLERAAGRRARRSAGLSSAAAPADGPPPSPEPDESRTFHPGAGPATPPGDDTLVPIGPIDDELATNVTVLPDDDPAPPEPVRPQPESFADVPPSRWVEADHGTCPISHPIKANERSMIYHEPGTAFYERTHAERCYATTAAAADDGYRPPRNHGVPAAGTATTDPHDPATGAPK